MPDAVEGRGLEFPATQATMRWSQNQNDTVNRQWTGTKTTDAELEIAKHFTDLRTLGEPEQQKVFRIRQLARNTAGAMPNSRLSQGQIRASFCPTIAILQPYGTITQPCPPTVSASSRTPSGIEQVFRLIRQLRSPDTEAPMLRYTRADSLNELQAPKKPGSLCNARCCLLDELDRRLCDRHC